MPSAPPEPVALPTMAPELELTVAAPDADMPQAPPAPLEVPVMLAML